MRSVLSLGSWLMLRTLSMRIASLLTVFVVARFGTEHTAAYQLGMGVFNLFLYALDSLAIAAQALLGKELGERDLNVESERVKVRQLKNRLLRMSLIYGVITGLICPLIGFFGSWLFTKDAQVAFLFTIATVIIALGQPIAAYVFTLDGILMGAQDVKYLAIGCFIMLVMYVPVMLGLHWAVGAGAMDALAGYCGLWAAYILYFQGIRAVIFGRRARSDVWMKAGAE
jgi:Na+-driven multidrug efflux pump